MGLKFSPEMIDYLSKLYVHERHNSLVYSHVSNYLNIQGFKNLSKYYEDWSQHEIKHSKIVRAFANEQNIILNMYADSGDKDIDITAMSVTYFVDVTVGVEMKTSEMYNHLLDMAIAEDNGFVKDFAYGFIKEQREETDKANTIHDSIKNIGDDIKMLQLFDSDFED